MLALTVSVQCKRSCKPRVPRWNGKAESGFLSARPVEEDREDLVVKEVAHAGAHRLVELALFLQGDCSW